ncbi:MAG: hypothetical protein K2P81_07290 [Bacteriovoracaceae bacterium]|nr:hypothetical protein [Bacteriovoracaceae bacterium]
MKGLLTLIPTPLKADLPLEPVALSLLHKVALDPHVTLLVEEHKVARQRWLKWGLPREAIERFVLFNEHTVQEVEPQIIESLKAGEEAILFSDGGLPAFCDPGQSLVNRCHEKSIKVTSTPFPNSIALAVSLSGFSHQRFIFCGFLPQKDPERGQAIQEVWKSRETQILMETPYRRQKFLEELLKSRPQNQKNRRVFIALELNGQKELLVRGELSEVIKKCQELEKLEYVLVIDCQP